MPGGLPPHPAWFFLSYNHKYEFYYSQDSSSSTLFSSIYSSAFSFFWSNLPLYTQSFDLQVAKDAYFSSTYIRGDKGKSILSDSDLYLVEGHFLVGENYDLKKLTPGYPPLGKYLIGFSWKYLGNPYILQFVSFTLVLVLISLLAGTPLLGLIFSFEPLLIEQLSLTLLDIYFLVLVLSSSSLFR